MRKSALRLALAAAMLVPAVTAASASARHGVPRSASASTLGALTFVRLAHHRIAVTTALPTWTNDYPWLEDSGQGYVGFHHDTTAPDGAYGFATNLGGNPGLWLYPIGGQRYVPAQAEFTYTAPGTTRLLSASLDIAYRNKVLAHHCLDVGLRTDDTIVDSNDHCEPVHPPDSQAEFHVDLADPNADPVSKVLYFQLLMPDCQSGPCDKNIPALDPLENGGYARLKGLRMVLVDDDLPTVSPSGAFFDLASSYINGTQTYGLTTSADDQGSGVQRAWVERVGDGELASGDAPCDPGHNTEALDNRICPQDYSFASSIDTSSLPEGRNDFVVKASDVAGNVGQSDSWPVFVDRTPPTPVGPGGFSVAWYDRSTHDAAIGWDEGGDPALPDGSPGSGIGSYSYRYNLAGSGWTDWTTSDKSELLVPGVSLGDSIQVEVRATDDVGNVSDPVDGNLVVDDAAATPPDDVPDAPTVCKDGAPDGSCDAQIGGGSATVILRSTLRQADDPVPYTRSIYEHQATTSILNTQGCNAGNAKARGAVILAFGRPAFDGTNYGTVDYNGNFISNAAIVNATKAYIRGFVRCSDIRGPRMKVATGTTNGCVNGQDHECCPTGHCGEQIPNFHRAGAEWSKNIEAIGALVDNSAVISRQVAARGADDIEPAWEPDFKRTLAFINGYNDTGLVFYALYDFGSGERVWTDAQVYQVAYGLKEWPFPQIYLETMADDWVPYSKYDGLFGKMHFVGVLSQYKKGQDWVDAKGRLIAHNCGLSPEEGRQKLLDRITQKSIAYISDIVCYT
jgi:hypothetical protein